MRIAPNTKDPDDLITRQFSPTANELRVRNEERSDPVGDNVLSKLKRLTRRYRDRVLLLLTQTCQVYCRYCFRREKVVSGKKSLRAEELAAALEHVRETPEVWEVVLSGDDLFALGDRHLEVILESLEAIEHVKVIRLPVRLPVVEPARITEKLLDVLSRRRCAIYIVHINHPNELTKSAKDACAAHSHGLWRHRRCQSRRGRHVGRLCGQDTELYLHDRRRRGRQCPSAEGVRHAPSAGGGAETRRRGCLFLQPVAGDHG